MLQLMSMANKTQYKAITFLNTPGEFRTPYQEKDPQGHTPVFMKNSIVFLILTK